MTTQLCNYTTQYKLKLARLNIVIIGSNTNTLRSMDTSDSCTGLHTCTVYSIQYRPCICWPERLGEVELQNVRSVGGVEGEWRRGRGGVVTTSRTRLLLSGTIRLESTQIRWFLWWSFGRLDLARSSQRRPRESWKTTLVARGPNQKTGIVTS
jgi:hypothetical protein